MSKETDFAHLDIYPASHVDAFQEQASGSASNLRIAAVNTTTLRLVAGAGAAQSGLSVNGLYRWRAASGNQDVTVSGAAGVKEVYAVASANNILANDVDATDRNFYIVVTPFGDAPTGNTPNGDPIERFIKIGELRWDGTKITAVRQILGHGDSTLPINPAAGHATVTPLAARGAASQSAPLAAFEDSTGAALATVTANGGLASSSADGLVLSGAGGRDTINLSSTAFNTGITIGGDVEMYRSAPGVLSITNTLSLAGQFALADGSAAAPSLAFGDDLNTGIFSAAGDSGVVAVSSNGTERLRVDATGALVSGSLQVTSTSLFQNIVDVARGSVASAVRAFVTGDVTERFRLQTDGQIAWGPGNAAVDVSLARSGVGVLAVTGALAVSNGGAITGVMTAPTAAPGTNTTQLATTAFVTNAVGTMDPTLVALAAYNTNGLLTQTDADTFTGRSITGTANQITVANGSGVGGDPTLSLPATVAIASNLAVGSSLLSQVTARFGRSIADPGAQQFGVSDVMVTTLSAPNAQTLNSGAFQVDIAGTSNHTGNVYGVQVAARSNTSGTASRIVGVQAAAITLAGAGAVTSAVGAAYQVNSAGAAPIASGTALEALTPLTTTPITNYRALTINVATTGITDSNYGIYVNGAPGGATTNAAIALADTSGAVAGGILFGGDTALYRNASGVLTASGYFVARIQINDQTGATYTVQASDSSKHVRLTRATGQTVTLPAGIPIGTVVEFSQGGAGQTTFVAGAGAQPLQAYQNNLKTAGLNAGVTAEVVAADTWYLVGGLVA